MSKCEKYLDMISEYADGELNAAEKAELEAHLAACEECRSLLETYRSISDTLQLGEEEVPKDFAAGVMEKVDVYEKNAVSKSKKRTLGIAGRWIGIAACIAIVLVAFPRMPGLGCGASSADSATFDTTTGAAAGGAFGGVSDAEVNESAMPESSVDYSHTDSDDADSFTITTDGSSADPGASDTENKASPESENMEIGLVVTIYGGEIPDVLLESEYEVIYYENGEIEFIVPVSFAREIMSECDNVEAEALDTDIDDMWARIIIKK